MITITQDQQKLFDYIDSLISGNGHLIYDFRDERQYQFAWMMAELSGRKHLFPGMFKSLERMRSFHEEIGSKNISLLYEKQAIGVLSDTSDTDGWQNMFKIPGLNLTPDGNIASNGLATVVGGFSNMNLSLIVQSRSSKNIVAHGFNNGFAQNMLSVDTEPSTSNEIDVNAYLHYHGLSQNNSMQGIPLTGIVKRKDTSSVTATPIVSIPKRETNKPNNPKAINIGLGRAWTDQGYPQGSGGNPNSQFDYAWNESIPPSGENPKGKIPFVGSVTFSKDISSPLEYETNFLLKIYVADKTGGGGVQLSPSDDRAVAKAFSIDPNNPAKLNWNLAPGTSTTDPGNPIQFSNVPWGSDTLAYFFCEIDVVLQDRDGSASAYIQSSLSPDSDALDGTAYIMPIDFIWHCLAEDSLVTMADGSKKEIKEIVAGDKVQINDKGEIATVQWTNLGVHKGHVLKITTESGKEIIASDNHVFISNQDYKPARELEVGETITTTNGAEKISTLERVEYDGLMCNLATVTYQDPNNPSSELGTYYANDILVGDINAQRVIKKIQSNDINWIKKQVPAYLHTDVENYFSKNK